MPLVAHYSERSPDVASRPGRLTLAVRGLPSIELTSDRGVFSGARVDPGTAVLLETVPPPPAVGALLDLGCGYGPIALTLARWSPGATVWGVDVNERAVALCVANATTHLLPNVRAVAVPAAWEAADGDAAIGNAVEGNAARGGAARGGAARGGAARGDAADEEASANVLPTGLRWAAIYSNPPIRVGKGSLQALLDRWLPELDDGADAWLVVQKHLGADSLQRWLVEERGWACDRIASRKGYRVLRVGRPGSVGPAGRVGRLGAPRPASPVPK